MGLKEIFFPKKRDFYGMILKHAAKTEEGLKALNEFVKNPSSELGNAVDNYEKEADELRRHLVNELNESFVTPIDREDIFAITKAIDDIVDYAKSTVEEIRLFKVGPNEYLLKITEALYNMTTLLKESLALLSSKPLEAHDKATKVKKAENFIEHRYREALAELFESDDVITVLKYREIYRHLSNAADRGDVAADIIQHVIVKIT